MENNSPDQKEKMMEKRDDRRTKFQNASPEERKEMRENRRERREERNGAKKDEMKPSNPSSSAETSDSAGN